MSDIYKKLSLFFPFLFVVSKLFTTFVAKNKKPTQKSWSWPHTDSRLPDYVTMTLPTDSMNSTTRLWESVCQRKALKAFFECHNQVDLITIYYHFSNIVYWQKLVHFQHHKSKTNVNRKRYSLTVDSFQKRFFCVTVTVLQFLKTFFVSSVTNKR